MFAGQDNSQAVEDRRKLAPGYALNAMLVYEGNVDRCISLLCQKLRERVSPTETVDLRQWIISYAFDIQGSITVRCYVFHLLLGLQKEIAKIRPEARKFSANLRFFLK